MAALETQGLTHSFHSVPVIMDVSLRVPEGSIYGFLGPNGAGKTTAMRCITGLIQPDEGQISVLGETHPKRRLQGVGAMVETPAFYGHFSGAVNLQMAAAYRGLAQQDIRSRLAEVGLLHAADQKVASYSLGMKQRLGLARALLGDPKLLILDEPSNGLDPEGMARVRRLLKERARAGVTLFVSSHLLLEIEHLATHLGILSQGGLLAQGEAEDLLRSEELLELEAEDSEALQRALSLRSELRVLGEGETGRLRLVSPLLSASELNAWLHTQGVALSALVPARQTLEDLYLSLTAQEQA